MIQFILHVKRLISVEVLGSSNYQSRCRNRKQKKTTTRPRRETPPRMRSRKANEEQGFEIFIDNLPPSVSRNEVKNMLKVVGDVVFIEVHKIRGKGTGEASFQSRDEMHRAIDMFNKQSFKGYRIRVRESRWTKEDSQNGSN